MPKIPINLKTAEINDQQESELIVGIDLGTTNSIVAFVENGKPIAIKDEEGRSAIMPSILYFDEDLNLKVGKEATEGLIKHPERTIYSVKRLMGKSYKDLMTTSQHLSYRILEEDEDELVKVNIEDKYFSPIELSAEILKALKKRIENYLDEKVEKAVITVPAYFNDNQRQATRDAGKLAGLDVLRIVNEPTAASLAYGINHLSAEGETIAVYDLGGGTFDISILSIEGGVFEVLSTAGDTYLGGDDFDIAIVNYWIQKYPKLEEHYGRDSSLRQALRLKAEEAKKELSSNDNFVNKHGDYDLTIERETFNSLIFEPVMRTVNSCERALEDAKLDKSDIDHIIMVGGSTRVPFVKDEVSKFFKKDVNDNIDPDLVVALGAAIQADILAGNQKDILLLDVTPLSLGIETVGGLMDVIIPRNSKVPTRVGRKYTTSVDGQKNLKVAVYQGERDLVQDNRKLAEFILSDIPPMPAGIPKIEIHFILDADGILQVKAQELRSGKATQIDIRPQYGISEEEMGKMLKESIEHAKEDMQKKALIEARTEGQNIVRATDKFIQQNESLLSDEQIEELRNYKENLVEKIEGDDKDAIQKAMDELNEYAKPLAKKSMDSVIGEAMKGKKVEE